jgi:hypothetical protein
VEGGRPLDLVDIGVVSAKEAEELHVGKTASNPG